MYNIVEKSLITLVFFFSMLGLTSCGESKAKNLNPNKAKNLNPNKVKNLNPNKVKNLNPNKVKNLNPNNGAVAPTPKPLPERRGCTTNYPLETGKALLKPMVLRPILKKEGIKKEGPPKKVRFKDTDSIHSITYVNNKCKK